MNILLVEDDPVQAAAVERAVHRSPHTLNIVGHADSAIRFLKANEVDLVMLDWQLPGMTGLELLRWVRGNLGDKPVVLFLTNRTLEVDVVQALGAGADDYIFKPFRIDELVARIGALLRRVKRNEHVERMIAVGLYNIDTVQHTVSVHDKLVKLTTKEFALISYLFANVGQVISRDLLAKLAWGRELDGTSRTVDTHIYRLRKKLFLYPENGVRLAAVYTHGYRLDMVAICNSKKRAQG